MKKLRIFHVDYAQRADTTLRKVGTLVLTLAFASMASVYATDWFVTTNGSGDGSSWASPTNSIQGAITASSAGDTVLVSNGVYETGGVTNYPSGTLLTNRIAIYKAITVRSANNDPTNTIIKGAWDPATNGPSAVRCVYMTNGSALIGFTLTNGAVLSNGVTTARAGGGVLSQSTNTVISNCVIAGNSANWGGGAWLGALYNCTLSGNSASVGGGAYGGILSNCTATGNLATALGGGAYASTLYNCTLSGNAANQQGGGAYGGILSNCTLSGNAANLYGGGTYYGCLYNCAIVGNRATNTGGFGNGGGTCYSTQYNCTLTDNSVTVQGGGAYGGILYNCALTGNRGNVGGSCLGGGAMGATLYNCTLTGNSNYYGGGAGGGALYNCIITGNSAGNGGGAYNSALYNCTLTGNSAGYNGGGASLGALINTIVYFNSSPNGANWTNVAAFTNSCTVPAATNGVGNTTNDPLFIANGSGYGTNHVAGNYRLRGNSPARNTGTNFPWMTDPADARSKDLDVRPRINGGLVDMGCYEFLSAGTMFMIH